MVSDLNEVAHHRPRSTLILGSQEENARIRELQQENIELQTSVAEYQSALELIMAKYREQVRMNSLASRHSYNILTTYRSYVLCYYNNKLINAHILIGSHLQSIRGQTRR